MNNVESLESCNIDPRKSCHDAKYRGAKWGKTHGTMRTLMRHLHGAVPVPFRYHNEDDEEDDESSLSLTGLAVRAGTARCSELPFQQVMQNLS